MDNSLFFRFLVENESLAIQGFGIFTTEPQEAYIHPIDNSFSPRGKKISFRLDKNTADNGFLQFMAAAEGLSRVVAASTLKSEITKWIKTLKSNGVVDLPMLGVIKLNSSGNVIFVQNNEVSADKKFFGLKEFKAEPVETAKAKPATPVAAAPSEQKKKRRLLPWMSAAAIVIIIAGGIWFFKDMIFSTSNVNTVENTGTPVKTKTSETVETENDAVQKDNDTNQNTASDIDKPDTTGYAVSDNSIAGNTKETVDTQEVTETRDETVGKETQTGVEPEPPAIHGKVRYYVIAGCFRNPEKADAFLNELKQKGYDATIEGKTPGGLIRVCYGGYSSWRKAAKISSEINSKENTTSWVQRIEK
jgi:cell division protein FtsN